MKKSPVTTNYINHIAFVVDASGSMARLADTVVKVFDAQIDHLANRSAELCQETRVSVYFFAGRDRVRCAIFDRDVLRVGSLRGLYQTGGQTALVDATYKAVTDLKTTSQLYGDHAFLVYVLTDGEENDSLRHAPELAGYLADLPDHWTVAVLVPNAQGLHEAKRAGFSPQNIAVWDANTIHGLEEVSRAVLAATDNFMQARATGVRGTRSLFTLNAAALSAKRVNDNLAHLTASECRLLFVPHDVTIRDFVEKEVGTFVKGSAYYQLTKAETIQDYKQVCIQNKVSGFIYTGANARQLLGLPATTAKIKPEDLGRFHVFVQSTSVNRRLVGGTTLLVLGNFATAKPARRRANLVTS